MPEEYYPRAPNVPPISQWGRRGLAGEIGVGPHAGKPVLAMLHRSWVERLFGRRPSRNAWYILRLPVEDMPDADGAFLMESFVTDVEREDGAGGLIDLLTSSLEVEWSADDAAYQRAVNWYLELDWGDD